METFAAFLAEAAEKTLRMVMVKRMEHYTYSDMLIITYVNYNGSE